ncbi:MAG: hypothetical protein R8K20_10600 [Gallionellaceae bacterium]
MRLIFALIYMAVGMWLYYRFGGEDLHPFVAMGVWFTLMSSSVIVCNEGFIRKLKGQSDDQYIDELLGNNQASEESYEAIEAITFEDLGTSCLCHIINVGNNTSLCLYGQYLYEYTEIDDDPDLNQKRLFPTSKFNFIRNNKSEEILRFNIGDIVIGESYFENVDIKKLHDLGIKLEDGELIKNVQFSEIKGALNG